MGGGLEIYRCSSFLHVWIALWNTWFSLNSLQFQPRKRVAVFHAFSRPAQRLTRVQLVLALRPVVNFDTEICRKQRTSGAIIYEMALEELRPLCPRSKLIRLHGRTTEATLSRWLKIAIHRGYVLCIRQDRAPFPMTSLNQPTVLTQDTFYDYLLIIGLAATCEEGLCSDFPHEIISCTSVWFTQHKTFSRRRTGNSTGVSTWG